MCRTTHKVGISHRCLFLGSGDALVRQVQILMILSLKLSLVIFTKSFLLSLSPSTFSQQVQYYGGVLCPVGMCGSSMAGHTVFRGFTSDATVCITYQMKPWLIYRWKTTEVFGVIAVHGCVNEVLHI